jgi:hypothetical protein
LLASRDILKTNFDSEFHAHPHSSGYWGCLPRHCTVRPSYHKATSAGHSGWDMQNSRQAVFTSPHSQVLSLIVIIMCFRALFTVWSYVLEKEENTFTAVFLGYKRKSGPLIFLEASMC